MNNIKRGILFIIFVAVLFGRLPVTLTAAQDTETVFAMCHPTLKQVKNIEFLLQADFITLEKTRLLAIYHEDEVTDFDPAREYVAENKLDWVEFIAIKGDVQQERLFGQNLWTRQFKDIFDRTSGIIFTGGADIPPAIYSEETLLLTEPETITRSLYEVSFLFHLVGGQRNPAFPAFLSERADYVVLGICLGSQSLNVAAGGTLYQDIPTQVYKKNTYEQVLRMEKDNIHSSRYRKALAKLSDDGKRELPPCFHRIKLKKNSMFVKRMGIKKKDPPYVLTSHHQAYQRVGKELNVTATSMDGKIGEALEHKKYKNVLGIQFHPEPYPLYLKNYYYRRTARSPLDFSLRGFLLAHPGSMGFHRKLWAWFSQALREGRKK